MTATLRKLLPFRFFVVILHRQTKKTIVEP